ncbi:MAG: response regulator [Gammaproteobacteria bacterium]|nr:response regulator [Gammaproteobacteria bacterium]
MAADAFVTSREAAELLGVSLRTVQLWVENDVLQAWKTAGGHRRISRRSVDRILKQQQQASGLTAGDGTPVVLVVEDNAEMRRLYERYFQLWQLPARLLVAANGFEGLIRIGQHSPRLVITDLSMPGMDGFQMIKALHSGNGLQDMQLMVVTGLSHAEISENGGLPSEIEIKQKPVNFKELEPDIRQRLGIKLVQQV